jgi:hypothetical protein
LYLARGHVLLAGGCILLCPLVLIGTLIITFSKTKKASQKLIRDALIGIKVNNFTLNTIN